VAKHVLEKTVLNEVQMIMYQVSMIDRQRQMYFLLIVVFSCTAIYVFRHVVFFFLLFLNKVLPKQTLVDLFFLPIYAVK